MSPEARLVMRKGEAPRFELRPVQSRQLLLRSSHFLLIFFS